MDEPGNQLLHWDLHYDNVLGSAREPWLAIDPKPLAGDPGFELLPALTDRFDDVDIRWRFDLMTEALNLDRDRARAWDARAHPAERSVGHRGRRTAPVAGPGLDRTRSAALNYHPRMIRRIVGIAASVGILMAWEPGLPQRRSRSRWTT